MAYGLLKRIITFGLEQGFWTKDSVLGDPFFGIGTTGIVAAYNGLRVIGCELEPRFHALALENMKLHRHKWERIGCPAVEIDRLRVLLREGVAGTHALLSLDMEASELADAVCSEAHDWMDRVRKELGE